MNYLAHIFLSGNDPDIITGNFAGDHVKGKNYERFTAGMIKGVELHRAIDTFTDSHPVVTESKKRLRPVFHKYSPVIIDVFYDHFLAANWKDHADISLEEFTQQAYTVLDAKKDFLPPRAQRMLSYMMPQNWLLHYADLGGIHKALSGMASRAQFSSGMEKATDYLEKDYKLYQNEFTMFFPELKKHCEEFLQKNLY